MDVKAAKFTETAQKAIEAAGGTVGDLMFKTLINAWNVKDIRTKMLYTLLLVVIYRFGSFIPVPGVDASKIAAAAVPYSILSFLNLLRRQLRSFTIFAMGITPYITGSIIIRLLTIAIPSLEDGPRRKMAVKARARITRYTGIGLALVQSIGIVSGPQNQAQIVTNPSFFLCYHRHRLHGRHRLPGMAGRKDNR